MNILKSKEKNFWNWFESNISNYTNSEDDNIEKFLDELLCHLQNYSKGLFYEISSTLDGDNELIITANGDITFFSDLEKLIKYAPKLDNWVITGYKPPMEREFIIESDYIIIDTNKVFFEPLENANRPKELGLMVFIEGYDESRELEYNNMLYIALQTIVGEKSFAEDISHIEICNLPLNYEQYISIKELPEYIAWKYSKIN